MTRPGAISGNRTARYQALDTILDRYTPLLTRLPAGLAYVRPAVFAYRDGADEFGERWARQAFSAGRRELARDHWGLSLLAWHQPSPQKRARMRQARDTLRASFYRSADLAARLASTGSPSARRTRSAATPSRWSGRSPRVSSGTSGWITSSTGRI